MERAEPVGRWLEFLQPTGFYYYHSCARSHFCSRSLAAQTLEELERWKMENGELQAEKCRGRANSVVNSLRVEENERERDTLPAPLPRRPSLLRIASCKRDWQFKFSCLAGALVFAGWH